MCFVRLDEPLKICSSRDSRNLICSGSSASANCSARSPVSLQENSESEEDLEREDRRPCFSEEREPSNAAECSSVRADKVLRGMFAGRRDELWEGIVKVVDCLAAALSACWGKVQSKNGECDVGSSSPGLAFGNGSRRLTISSNYQSAVGKIKTRSAGTKKSGPACIGLCACDLEGTTMDDSRIWIRWRRERESGRAK